MQSNALTVVHKLIRAQLFEVCGLVATAGEKDMPRVVTGMEAARMFLEGHAAHEDATLEPALRAVAPSEADRLAREHRELHAELDAVCEAASRAASPEQILRLHLDWHRFVARYLLHLDAEEREWSKLIELPPLSVLATHARERGESGLKAFLEQLEASVAPAELDVIRAALPSTD